MTEPEPTEPGPIEPEPADAEAYDLTVNPDVCEAHGRCVDIDPEIFELDDDELLHIHRPHPGPDDLGAVRRAVRSCPKAALTLSPARR